MSQLGLNSKPESWYQLRSKGRNFGLGLSRGHNVSLGLSRGLEGLDLFNTTGCLYAAAAAA